MQEDKSKKRVQCACCRRKLVTVFSVCRCRYMYCCSCVDPRVHMCSKLQEFVLPLQQPPPQGQQREQRP